MLLKHISLFLSLISVRSVPLNEFYPFGNSSGDTAMSKNDDGSTPDIPISTRFPFFNHQHDHLIVNTNGAISFLHTLSQYTPDPFPLDGDRRLITAYWGDVDTRKGGTIYYRETINPSILSRASSEIQHYLPKFVKFQASWVLIATWDRVAFYGCKTFGCSKRNTFQTVLVTNGRHSFAIFNYDMITWTTGTASQGGSTTGLGGIPAQVGFNAGDGIVYYAVNASRTPEIIHINQMSNVGVPGKFVFRVDSAEIDNAGCRSKGGSLTVVPRYGPMLGGQLLTLGGPCLNEDDQITIQFSPLGASEYKCKRLNKYSVSCVTPMFMTTGDITLTLKVRTSRGSTTDSASGIYTVLNPATFVPPIKRSNVDKWIQGEQYRIEWDPENDELSANRLRVELFSLMDEKGTLRWTSQTIGEVNKSLGQSDIIFDTEGFVSAIKLSPAVKSSNDREFERGIWSDIFPSVSRSAYASSVRCQRFIQSELRQQQSKQRVDIQLDPCPCTLRQALLDTARFSPDPECNSLQQGQRNRRNCIYRKDATHCVRLGKQGLSGSDNLCCFDTKGNLIDSRNMEGGFIQKYHYLGGKDNIPYISNLYFDTVPFLQCCRYSHRSTDLIDGKRVQYSMCQPFFKIRRASDCHGYNPPRPARTSGDPHISTLDGFPYTFNGVGEFHLIEDINKKFGIQIRFQQYENHNGILANASVTSAIAMVHYNMSDTIEVRLNSIRTADVYVNGHLQEFDSTDFTYIQYKGASIYLASENTSDSNLGLDIIVALSELQISVAIQAKDRFMNVMPIIANDGFKGRLRGLLGNFNGQPSDDLTSAEGRTLNISINDERIYYGFGNTWRVRQNESIFKYLPGESYSKMQNLHFRPIFQTGNPQNIPTVCGSDLDCAFDFQVTKSLELAETTLQFVKKFDNATETADEVIKTCTQLPDVENGAWNSSNGQIEGSTAISICNPGMRKIDEVTITCSNGSWVPLDNFTGLCEIVQTTTDGSITTEQSVTTEQTLSQRNTLQKSTDAKQSKTGETSQTTKQSKRKTTTKNRVSKKRETTPNNEHKSSDQKIEQTTTDVGQSSVRETTACKEQKTSQSTSFTSISTSKKISASSTTTLTNENDYTLSKLNKKINIMWMTTGGGILLILVAFVFLMCVISCNRRKSSQFGKSDDSSRSSNASLPGMKCNTNSKQDLFRNHTNHLQSNLYKNRPYMTDNRVEYDTTQL